MRKIFTAAVVDQYVDHLSVRTTMTRRVYRCILGGFVRFVDRAAPGRLSQTTIQRWLQDRKRVWPCHLILHRARLVDRFLDWAVEHRKLAVNPLAELRKSYGPHTTPIIRALLSADPPAELERIRPVPRFSSHLGALLKSYLEHQRTMGFRADDRGFLRFDRFLLALPDAAAQPLPILVDQWARAASSPTQQLLRIRVGRSVARAMARTGHPVSLPKADPRLCSAAKRHQRRPYIYSSEEIQRLLLTARTFPSPRSPLRPRTLYTMLILAYCLGLRLGELVNLKLQDVNLAEPWLDIRESKFFKSRRLLLPSSVAQELQSYLKARQQIGALEAPDSPLFWHEQGCRGYSRGGAYWLLVQILRRAGLKAPAGRVGPRLHDLRHAFAVHRLGQWYEEGIDPQPRLPYLAAYLGHNDIRSTLVYLTTTQQLLNQANERFHRIGAQVLTSTHGENLCS